MFQQGTFMGEVFRASDLHIVTSIMTGDYPRRDVRT